MGDWGRWTKGFAAAVAVMLVVGVVTGADNGPVVTLWSLALLGLLVCSAGWLVSRYSARRTHRQR